ncbi:cyclin-d1-1 [Phtheirospermum japonicum]|uniref:Cyclin-d1-1 n=1 Tax=Phtheirospermum japonicum TaxID=374723 RepID=A0A830D4J5_9LAMI|nr:cyclin-d1-1 [Phtheirospermum japonicum]
MDSLLCNEVWLMSPKYNELDDYNNNNNNNNVQENYHDHVVSTKEDCEEALRNFLRKEANYMPERGYLEFVKTNHVIVNARFKAVNWLIKSQRRMNLSPGTVFLAVNYMDRFISLTRCQDWKYWMFELLCVACLTIATKFSETTTWPLHEYQVEGVDNCFSPTLIQRMELTVLKALGWRMDSTTPFSYVHILTRVLNETLIEDLTNHVTELLLCALLDPKFLEFQQCVVAMSAIRCVFEASVNNDSIANLDSLIPQDQKVRINTY